MHAPELHWLPAPQPDWGPRLQALATPDAAAWATLQDLARTRLDALATIRLDRRLQRLFATTHPPGLATTPIRLAVLGSSTLDHLLPALRVGALRRGLWLILHTGEYGQYATDLADPPPGGADTQNDLTTFSPDTVLLALDAPHLLRGLTPAMDAASAHAQLDDTTAALARLWSQAQARGWGVVQQTALPTAPLLLGNNEHRLPGSPAAACQRLNARLRDLADAHGVDLLALDAAAAQDGIAAWHDPVLWHRAKQEVHPGAAPLYGDLLARILAARQGRAAKALVLDLDNTLWGGVIGDDGMAGIVLGQGSTLGEAHAAFQSYARALSQRGIILAVCSKNDERNALEPFDAHPEMVLRRTDIACFVANWTDKATNLREIARRLNIGLDSLVFADDNPAERAIIRQELPMVAVPELPEDPALFASTIAAAGYFEATRLTDDDRARTTQYQANLQREAARQTEPGAAPTDMDAYLRSLDMELRWSRFDPIGAPRIVQLVNKTNQFNLTTRRTTPEAVAALIADDTALSLQLRLLDRFGDNGIIAIVHGHRDDKAVVIDTWLMSCRVLGRGAEAATLNLVAAEAARLGATRLTGEYRPTEKNAMVQDHYPRLGFTPLGEPGPDGATRWTLDLATFTPAQVHMRITSIPTTPTSTTPIPTTRT